MSLSSIIGIARSALMAHQRAMSVTANNIANANTPGYTRQRLVLEAIASRAGGTLAYGGGVVGRDVQRIRDPFLDATFRSETALLGESQTTRYFLEQVEGAINEPSDSGVSAALDSLFQAFGDLANDPSSGVAREEVRRAAERFAFQVRHLGDAINRSLDQAVETMRAEVEEVNAIARELSDLNAKIVAAQNADAASPELLDQRDQLLDRLAEMVSIDVGESADGSITVTAGGATLVSGDTYQQIAVKSLEGGGFGLGPAVGDQLLSIESGSLKALSELTSVTLPDLLRRLDVFTQAVVTEVNELHHTGVNADGESNVDFFDPAGLTAATISVSDAVSASASAIAAGLTGDPGDNELALQLAALGQQDISMLGNETFSSFYSGFAASVGSSVRDAINGEYSSQTLVNHADARRASVAGVSIDEEMINLIGQQEAYTAAARLVSVADQMMQEILSLAG